MGVIGLNALRTGQTGERRTTRVAVPAWGGEVLLRELNGRERTELLEGVIDLYGIFQRNGSASVESGAELRQAFEYACKVVRMTWVDAEGNCIVATDDDYDLLLQQDLATIFDLATAALTLSKMAPGSLDEAKKNSMTTTSAATGTV